MIASRTTSVLCQAVLLVGASLPAAAQDFAVRNARVFDGKQVMPRATVVVRSGLVERVDTSAAVPPGMSVIEAEGKTLLPGLIESHSHTRRLGLQQALALGVTTVLDMGSEVAWMQARRAEQLAGAAEGRADLFSAGNTATAPGGHGTQYARPPVHTIDDPADAEAFVAARLEEGSDYIKLIYQPCEGCESIDSLTMHALIAATRARGRLALDHAHLQAHARVAVGAGVHGLVHLFSDRTAEPALLELMAQRRVFVIASLAVIAAIAGHGGAEPLAGHPEIAPYLEPSQLQTLTMVNPNRSSWFDWQATTASLRLLRERGITILAGSDAPNVGAAYGAGVHRELELLVEAGLTPLEALAAATAAPARVFGLADRGRIAPGLRADLLLVAGDPTADITATRDIAAVWKRGVRFDRTAFRALLARVVESEARRAALPIGPGLLSDFDGDSIEATFGYGWHAASDVIDGGRSIAGVNLMAGGARGTRGGLRIEGNVVAGADAWAGVAFRPGAAAWRPGDLSGVIGLSFWARGDQRTYQVRMTSSGAQDATAHATVTFSAGNEWREYRFDLAAFEGIDPKEVLWLAVAAGPEPGPFAFQIDEVRLR